MTCSNPFSPRAALACALFAFPFAVLSLFSGCQLTGSIRIDPALEERHGPTNDIRSVDIDLSATLILVKCPPGQFLMGCPEDKGKGRSDEMPQHPVTLTKGFWIGRYEVTQAQWEAVMGANPSYHKQGADFPVEQVSWNDCQAFLAKLSERTGIRFRLPTEAEWEYACRAGSTGDYASSLHSRSASDMGWFHHEDDHNTHPIARKDPNAWGIHDMHGNVAEWCQDVFSRYTRNHVVDPCGPATGTDKVYRGGSAWTSVDDARSSCRDYASADSRMGHVGLRVAADLE